MLSALIPAGIGLVGSIIGGNAQKKAAKNAAKAQERQALAAIGEQRRQFDTTRSDFAPYLGTGTNALGDLGDLIGINGPEAQQIALGLIQNSPLMGRMVETGEEALLQNASATGGIRGGNTQRGLADFRADVFNQLLQQQIGHLGGLAGMGQNAVGSVANFGANKAANVGNLLGNIGQAQAGRHIAVGALNNQMINNISGALGGLAGKLFPGAGGIGGGAGGMGGNPYSGWSPQPLMPVGFG